MNKSNWKGRERKAAKFWGGKRTPLSGGNSGHTRADVIHDLLFIECKHDMKYKSLIKLYNQTKELATNENKIPVLQMSIKGFRGTLIVCHESDLTAVANQRTIAKKEEL